MSGKKKRIYFGNYFYLNTELKKTYLHIPYIIIYIYEEINLTFFES